MHLSHISIYGAAVIILIKCTWKAIVPVLTQAATYNTSTLLCEGEQAAWRTWKLFSPMVLPFWFVLVFEGSFNSIKWMSSFRRELDWDCQYNDYLKSSSSLFLQIITGTCCGLRCDLSFGSGTFSGVAEVASDACSVTGMLSEMVRVWLWMIYGRMRL